MCREFYISLGRLQGGGVRGKPEIADYVLEYCNTVLAVIEAKGWDKPFKDPWTSLIRKRLRRCCD